MDLLLKNGYVVDSASGFEGKADILIHDNRIREVGEDISAPEAQTVDCAGLTVIPGICDMHVHFRDPGQTHKEDIITGGNAGGGWRCDCGSVHAEHQPHYRQCRNGALHS